MKLLTLKCIKDPERMDECFEPDNQEEHWFVKLETNEEALYYRNFVKHDCPKGLGENHKAYSDGKSYGIWAGYMSAKLDDYYEDDDIYYYFSLSEPEPAVGEQYTDADGLVWERIE